MLRRGWLLRFRALAAVAAWLPLILDASGNGDLLFALPSVGLISGILPVRWFPGVAPAQLIMAATTISLVHRRETIGGWPFYTFFFLTLLLNLAVWLRERGTQPPRMA